MDKKEIKFPCRWEFRLIAAADSTGKTRNSVIQIGRESSVDFEICDGGTSGGGKYTAVRVACQVENIEQARELAGKLSKAEGVRFLI